MKNNHQFDLFELPEIVRIIATGIFGLLASLGVLFLLFGLIDFLTDQNPFNLLTLGMLLSGVLGAVIGWFGLYFLHWLERLDTGKCPNRYSYFFA